MNETAGVTHNDVLLHRANAVIARCSFGNYRITARESNGGVFLQATYDDADIYTGRIEKQHTRKWLLSPHMTESEIVSTVFKMCLASYEHRARELFKYRNARIYGPHFDVDDLVHLCLDGREDADGRARPQYPFVVDSEVEDC